MKKILSIVIATLLLLVVPVNAETGFSDVPINHWAYKYITQMAKEGAINGYSDGTFAPEAPVSRAEFCKIVVMATGKLLPSINEARKSHYVVPNVEGHWGELYMAAMSKYSWTYRDWFLANNTNADQTISRGEAAMGIADILYGYPRSYIGKENEVSTYLSNKYNDAETYLGFQTTVYEASVNGFMSGYEDGCFHVEKPVTRAELCTILYRTFSKDLEENLSEKQSEDFKMFGTIVLTMDKDSYLLYRTANNRIQKINGTPYLSNTDLQVRLETNFGDNILEKTLTELERTASGWNRAFIDNIIYFVQNDIEYLTDTNERDYAKFPYETLYDRGGDCEDKAILMCSLLNKAMYDVCLIVFQDHVGVGVNVEDGIMNGYYYKDNSGNKYYYLETTSPGWKLGEIPENYINETATLLFSSNKTIRYNGSTIEEAYQAELAELEAWKSEEMKKLYEYNQTNPLETDLGKSIMGSYADESYLSGNNGNIDSFAAANAQRQKQAIYNQRKQQAYEAHQQQVENILNTINSTFESELRRIKFKYGFN